MTATTAEVDQATRCGVCGAPAGAHEWDCATQPRRRPWSSPEEAADEDLRIARALGEPAPVRGGQRAGRVSRREWEPDQEPTPAELAAADGEEW